MESLTFLDRGVGRREESGMWMGDGSDDWAGLANTKTLGHFLTLENPMELGMAFWSALNSKGLCR